jgi:cold shock CspA family protein
MPLTGTLRSWNDDRGFGFIAPTQGGPEVFVHASAFPQDGSRPTIGEKLTYEIERGRDGKPQATKIIRLAVGDRRSSLLKHAAWSSPKTSWIGSVALLGLVVAAGAYGYNHFSQSQKRKALSDQSPTSSATGTEHGTTAGFRCDGRIHCSQMTSCTEAKWFIHNCPGTKMDGNNDGTPCEQQWCTSPFAK